MHAAADTGRYRYLRDALGGVDHRHAGICAVEMGVVGFGKLTATSRSIRQIIETIGKICHSLRVKRARMRAKLV